MLDKSTIVLSQSSINRAGKLTSSLTLREKIAQMIIADVKMYNHSEASELILKYVKHDKIGGVMFYKGSCEEQISLHNIAVSNTKIPLFIAIDAEWGLIMRLKHTPRFPVNMALGAIQDNTLIREYGNTMAVHCKRMGININFAPVLDVNSNPDNPIIGQRAFGDSPELVSQKGLEYSLGLESGGVLSVAKHFPGHGDTFEDSHKTLPTVNNTLEEIEQVELYPFRKYIESGCNGIMSAHLNVPALDSTSRLSTSLSPIIITDLLRQKLNFKGLVFTDALIMKGVSNNSEVEKNAVKAGNDILLMPQDVSKAIDIIEEATLSGEIDEKVIDSHCIKIIAYKYELKLRNNTILETNVINDLNSDDTVDLCKRLWANSITLLQDAKKLVGNIAPQKTIIISLGDDENQEYISPGDTMVDKRDFEKYNIEGLNATYTYNSMSVSLSNIEESEFTIIEVFSDKPKYIEAVEYLAKRNNTVIIFYMNPYRMQVFNKVIQKTENSVICAYEDAAYAQEMAQKGVFGFFKFKGKLPIKLNMS